MRPAFASSLRSLSVRTLQAALSRTGQVSQARATRTIPSARQSIQQGADDRIFLRHERIDLAAHVRNRFGRLRRGGCLDKNPVKIGQREYVDGGLVSPVPVRFAREMGAQLVVAVDISSPPEKDPPGDAFRMLMQTFSIMGRSINTFELRDADVVVRPRLDGVGSADFTARRRAIQAGREAAQAMLPLLRQRIAEKTR